jgi:MFS family permease
MKNPTDPPAPSPDGAATGRERRALVSLCLVTLLSSLGASSANVGLPTLARSFGASFQDVQWIVLAYLLAITCLIVGAGRLGDRLGRRRLLLGGVAVFTAASLLCGVAPTLGLLIAARAVQGMGAAVMMALTIAMIGDSVPKARTGRAMGLLGTMSAIGTALGPSAGGALLAVAGWPALFLVNAPLGVLAWVLARGSLPADQLRSSGQRSAFDVAGTLLLALTLAAYALAMTIGRTDFGVTGVGFLLAAAAVGLGLFLRVEARAAAPLVTLALFRDRAFRVSLAANALVSTVMMATLVVGPFFLSRSLGLNEALVGLVLASGPVASAFSGVPAGRLVDRFGADRMVSAGLVLAAAGAVALALLPGWFGVAGYVAAIALLTPGYQLFQAANNTAVMMDVPADRRGVTSGLLTLSRNLGLVSGASVMGAVFALATGDVANAGPEAVADGMRITFLVAGGLVMLAGLPCLPVRWRTA